jgi:TetR/AcrR family transcriptional regulator, transcriptional repressor for nem operon
MIAVMPKNTGENARDTLIDVGTELMRRSGYVGTSVDEICTAAGVTKGAFFHHFPSKEALAKECLRKWQDQMATLHRSAAYQAIADPVEKVLASIDFLGEVFSHPDVQKSCLAGTTVQEVSETNPTLREAAQTCFLQGEAYFKSLLDEASSSRGVTLDTASLARHWMATIQGSLLLWKASRDPAVIAENLMHFKTYLAGLLREKV